MYELNDRQYLRTILIFSAFDIAYNEHPPVLAMENDFKYH